ncbi:MAG: acyl carrier protein [Clostridia bacterium]|nr:acyl carrier protein [Clostridia bacterium]
MIIERLKKLTEAIMAGSDVNISLDDMNRDSRLVEDVCLNSISMLMLVIAIEEEFGIELPINEASHCVTVGEIADVIQGCLDAKA